MQVTVKGVPQDEPIVEGRHMAFPIETMTGEALVDVDVDPCEGQRIYSCRYFDHIPHPREVRDHGRHHTDEI